MKPLVYYDFRKDDNGNILIPEERLNQIINDVYNAGYNDGRKDNIYVPRNNLCDPMSPFKYEPYCSDTSKPILDKAIVTCNVN